METKLISQKDLDKIYREEVREKGGQVAFERSLRNKSLHHGRKDSSRSIFLCHSHRDKTVISKTFAFFDRLNIQLYVDWMDDALPKIPDEQTARSIHQKIKDCDKFIFLATARALESKWCSWELGLAYSIKGPREFAILPIGTRTGKWNGYEYLHLYPLVNTELLDFENLKEDSLYVSYPNKEKLSFIDWLSH
jgi:hypothetical protein